MTIRSNVKDGSYLLTALTAEANLGTEKGIREWGAKDSFFMEQLWELWGKGHGISSQRDYRSPWAEIGSSTSLSPKAAQAAFCDVVADVTSSPLTSGISSPRKGILLSS